MRPRNRWRLGAAAAAALLCGAACGEEPSSPHAAVWQPVLQWASTVLPSPGLVLKANRAPLVAGLDEEEYPCTSLSGPSCLWGQSQPQLWSRGRAVAGARDTRAAVAPAQGQGTHSSALDGASTVFVLPASPGAFHGLLSGGGDFLVLFLRDEATCGPACEQAVAAVHAAAPQLSVSGVRFVAVQCGEAIFAQTCRRHGVAAVPELRLYFGSTQLSVLFDFDVYRSLRRPKAAAEATSTSTDDDSATEQQGDAEEDIEEDGAGDGGSSSRGPNVWDGAAVLSFHKAHSTPLARALLTEARTLLRDWLGDGDSTPWSGEEGEEGHGEKDREGRAAAATSSSDDSGEGEGDEAGPERHSPPLRQAVQEALSTRLDDGRVARAMGDGASRSNSVAEFRKHMEGLLKEHHAAGGGGGSQTAGHEQPPNGISRSLPSKTRRKLHLVNTRGVACDALWVDFQGVERPFARIQPGRTATLSTFTSHLWRIRDAQTGGHVAFVLVTGRQGGGAPAEGDVNVLRYVIT
jgi:hypothetical protein